MTAAILLPLLAMGALELALRLAGYGYSTSFFRKMTIGGQECLVENPYFTRLFFPPGLARIPAPFVINAKKPPGTCRVFVFGESAAQGDPRPQFAASRYLKALLQERFPGRQFEVVNTGITAINSHAVVPIARDCAAHEGDFWVVYMGNNEMVGPFGAATVFGGKAAPVALVRLSLALRRWRLGQLVADLAGKLRPGSSRLTSWGGMEMFLQNEVPPTDKRREVVYENFRRNLDDILRAGTASGARVVLSTVAVNLKDCPPFSSEKPDRLAEPNKATYEKCCSQAAEAFQRGDLPGAAQQYARAVAAFPESADAHYQLALCLLALTNSAPAKQQFELACNCDTLPFRADSRLNTTITKAAARFASKGVVLCDAAGLLAATSPGDVPGQEYFYEHVHPTFEGNYELARAWAAEIARVLVGDASFPAAPEEASKDQCDRLIGLTDWNRVSVIEEVIDRMRQPPLSTQSNNSNRVALLQIRLASLREHMTAGEQPAARATYLEALRRAPGDYLLHANFAEFLEATGDSKEALAQRRIVAELTPQDYFSHLKVGMLLKEQHQYVEAEDVLWEAARLKPDQEEVRLELGAVCGLQKKYETALRQFERARQLAPGDPRPLLFAGEALWKMKRATESFARLRQAIQLKPDYVDAHYQLGEQLAQTMDVEGAMREFQAVIRLEPRHLKARVNLGVALARLGRPQDALRECEEALRIEPGNNQALQLRQQLLGGQGGR